MRINANFWAGFRAGLAAPTGLYAPPADYGAYIAINAIPQTFAAVGMFMRQAADQKRNDRPAAFTTSVSQR